MIRAPKSSQYWTSSVYSSMFKPDTDEAAEKLRFAALNLVEVKKKLEPPSEELKKHFSWENVADMLIDMCE